MLPRPCHRWLCICVQVVQRLHDAGYLDTSCPVTSCTAATGKEIPGFMAKVLAKDNPALDKVLYRCALSCFLPCKMHKFLVLICIRQVNFEVVHYSGYFNQLQPCEHLLFTQNLPACADVIRVCIATVEG